MRRPGLACFMGVTVALTVALTACGGAEPTETPAPSPTPVQARPSTGLSGLLATTDLSLGANRLSFLLVSPDALIKVPEASVASRYLPSDGSPPVIEERATAPFYLWPFGTRGNYATHFTFDKPGNWELDVSVQDEHGDVSNTRIPLKVKETSITPAIGSGPPSTRNKTLRDVTSLKQMTSWSTPDPELYEKTIDEALASNQPLVLVFSSPAFCTSPTCGPQVEAVQELKERYKDKASFIHSEVYDNPDLIQGDLDRGRYAPLTEAWNLTSIENYLNESWVFILDRNGRIFAKYEGFASVDELELGLLQVL